MKRVMIVDSLNLFVRNYIVSPEISKNGQPIGGVTGTIRSLQKLMRQTKPDEILFVWDGPGGSRKKKLILKDYKDGRTPFRLNRGVKVLSEQEEYQNKNWQQLRLFEYLNQFPIIQFLESGVEADDLISFVSQNEKYNDWTKIIVSSDKDFLQLCKGNTILFRPIQDKIETEKSIVSEFGIHPNNFALARSLDGDKSDNISGIPGIGLKTIAKNLPFLAESKTYLVEDLLSVCETKIKEKVKSNFYQKIIDNVDKVKINYSIMQLYSPSLSVQVANRARFTIENFKPEINMTGFRKLMLEDGVEQINFAEMCAMFNRIIRDQHVS